MKHLTQEQRYIIFNLKQSGKTQADIAAIVGYSQARPRKILKFKNPKENFFYNFAS